MKQVVIIGGGAAGILAAIRLADICRGVHITLAEKNPRIGKKLLSTGNGKCNITNSAASPASYDSALAKQLIARVGFAETKAYLQTLDILIKEDAAGRCYPLSESANNVLNLLLRALAARDITVLTDCEVRHIKPRAGGYDLTGTQPMHADAVLLACGSAASVKGYNGLDLLHNLGLRLPRPLPALCPIPSDEAFLKELKGVRVKGTLQLGERREAGEIQFTENAVSGICAFNLAKYVRDGESLVLNFNTQGWDDAALCSLLRGAAQTAEQNAQLLDFLLPRKLAFVLLKHAGLAPSGNPRELSNPDFQRLCSAVTAFAVRVRQPTDFHKAQTVCGGLDASLLNPDTLELRGLPGLFAGGELLDADGPCGGYNLQLCWSSALCAAEAIKQYLEKQS